MGMEVLRASHHCDLTQLPIWEILHGEKRLSHLFSFSHSATQMLSGMVLSSGTFVRNPSTISNVTMPLKM